MSTPTPRTAFLSAPPPAPNLPDELVASRYTRLRTQVFIGIFLGYAGYYLIRNNVPLVATLLLRDGRLDPVGMGLVANAVLIAYGVSKFLSAIASDRSDARLFLPLGLGLSAVVNILIAFVPVLSSTVAMFALVMFVNGWFQGMGWPPSGRILVHWFSTTERGMKTAVWNIAHNVGGAGAGILAAAALQLTGETWQAVFWMPAVAALVIAAVAFLLIRDTPASQGLPPIEKYRNDPAKVESHERASSSTWEIVKRHVVANPTMLALAFANVFVYALRYGILTWTPIYLSQVRGASVSGSIVGFSLFEIAGIGGTMLCGVVSDRVFRGNRSRTGVTFMIAVGAATAVYWLTPLGTPLWASLATVTVIGGLIYGPVMLIGLQALDLSPRHIAGTAAGFTGLFGYVLGATMASSGIGLVVERYGWDVTYTLLVVAAVITAALFLLVDRTENAQSG